MEQENKISRYYDNNRKKHVVCYYKKDEDTGKTKRVRTSFDTEKDAEQYQKELEYKLGNSIFIKNNSIPLCELMRFLEKRKFENNRIKENQYSKNLKTIERIENLSIGKKDISKISSKDIQNYFSSLTKYRRNYMQKFITQFTQAFNYAHAKGYISINPLIDTCIPESEKDIKTVRALEVEEQQILTDYLKNSTLENEKYKNVFLIQMYSGLRIGEVLALQNKDIDLQKKIMHIRKTLTRDENEKVIMGNTTKTFSGVREVPIQDIILNEIKEQMEISKNNFDGQLFVSSKGYYADPKATNKILKRIMVDICRVNDITTHSLRHTFGTRCIEAGIAPVVVQRLMGHKDIRVTLNTYTSVLNRFKEEELQKLDNFYQNKNISNNQNFDEEKIL